ncbi:ESX-1 secretion-associated protein [Mycobacterium sp. M1]|uniref:ESX-1 secretion-associated protein n=1 Tax=Mycolicibacter acidiphilus TaxID=2835306 RepID=A0ABS5RES6_9MYCO|nr:ESX-1 secretion-associated protein [Mycolicibacter acidiphilus]
MLIVDPAVLDSVAADFSGIGDDLDGLDAGAPLGDAAAGVPQLTTAAACRNAQSTVETDTAALADAARDYAESLHKAATDYRLRDSASAETITRVPVGG